MRLDKYVSGVTRLRWHANRRYEKFGVVLSETSAQRRQERIMRMANDSD